MYVAPSTPVDKEITDLGSVKTPSSMCELLNLLTLNLEGKIEKVL